MRFEGTVEAGSTKEVKLACFSNQFYPKYIVALKGQQLLVMGLSFNGKEELCHSGGGIEGSFFHPVAVSLPLDFSELNAGELVVLKLANSTNKPVEFVYELREKPDLTPQVPKLDIDTVELIRDATRFVSKIGNQMSTEVWKAYTGSFHPSFHLVPYSIRNFASQYLCPNNTDPRAPK